MAAVFENWEEEMMKKITEKAKNTLEASSACQGLPYESKEYLMNVCKKCLEQRPRADPSEVQDCLFKELGVPLNKMSEQLKECLEDLSKACSSYKDEAW
ncbi:MAG: hypothetical protein RXP86_10635 [Acidilobus sp.]|jgi:hypothetical protein